MKKLLIIFAVILLISCAAPVEMINKPVSFQSKDGLTVYGYVSKPAGSGKFPAVILIHGGSPPGAQNYTRWEKYAEELNKKGFATLALDYRGSSGYGKSFEDKAELGGKETDDVIAAIDFIEKEDFVDKDRIALVGESHGAFMALLAAEKDKRVKAVVDLYGFPDAISQFTYFTQSIAEGGYHDTPEKRALLEKILAERGLPAENKAAYESFSPAAHVKDLESPVLILHGMKDKSVLPSQSIEFEKLLKENNKESEMRLYDTLGHEFITNDTAEAADAMATTADFLERKLK